MSVALTINLEKPIESATILGSHSIQSQSVPGIPSLGDESPSGTRAGEQKAQQALFLQVNQALQDAVQKLNKFCESVFVKHKEQIARLAVEIARKVLVKKVEDGDYEIESIVKEAIQNAPARQDVVVHLNPEDLSQYRQMQEAGDGPAGVKFVPDVSVGRAECVVETPKGIVESLIDRHLEQVGNALMKVK